MACISKVGTGCRPPIVSGTQYFSITNQRAEDSGNLTPGANLLSGTHSGPPTVATWGRAEKH